MSQDSVTTNATEPAERARALLELAVRAGRAAGGALELADPCLATFRFGATNGRRDVLSPRDASGKPLARLTLFDAADAQGVEGMVAPVLQALSSTGNSEPPNEGLQVRVRELERELHHRMGNLLQGVASFMRIQAEDFDRLIDGSTEQARASVEDARLRVIIVGAVHGSLASGLDDDGSIETSVSLGRLCERLEGVLPSPVSFSTELAEFALPRDHVIALGTMLSEFVIAATRDVFPKPASHSVHLRTTSHHENGREHIAMILHHTGEGYDTRGWTQGAPRLAGRVVETLATQVDGLVAIDRSNRDEAGNGSEPGLRMRLVFDRPIARTVRGAEHAFEDEDGGRLPDTPHTFDDRLGVQTGQPAMRKS